MQSTSTPDVSSLYRFPRATVIDIPLQLLKLGAVAPLEVAVATARDDELSAAHRALVALACRYCHCSPSVRFVAISTADERHICFMPTLCSVPCYCTVKA